MSKPGLGRIVLQVGTVDGIFSVDVDLAGNRAQLLSASLRGSPIHAIAISPDDPRVVLVGCGEPGAGLYYSRDAGLTWEAPGMWPLGREVWALAFAPGDPRLILAGTQPAAVFRSHDTGYTWQQLDDFADVPGHDSWTFPHPPYEAHIRKLAFHPRKPQTLLAAIEVGGLLHSENAGETWRAVAGVDADVHSVAFSAGREDLALAATGQGLFRSKGDDIWEPVSPEVTGRYVVAIAPSPSDPSRLYTVGRGPRATIARSDDGGLTFARVSQELPSPAFGVDAFAVHPKDADTLLYGAHDPERSGLGCLFISYDGGRSWQGLDGNIDLPEVTRLAMA